MDTVKAYYLGLYYDEMQVEINHVLECVFSSIRVYHKRERVTTYCTSYSVAEEVPSSLDVMVNPWRGE